MTTRRLVALFLLLVGLTLAPGYVDNVDSRIILRTATRLVDSGSWGLDDDRDTGRPGEYGARGPDGAFQMKFGVGNAVLDVPFLVAGRAAFSAAGLPRERAAEVGVSLASALWFACCGALVFAIARRFASERRAAAVALVYAFATYAIVYAKSAYLETPLTAAVLLAFHEALRVRDDPGAVRPALHLGLACVLVLWLKIAACVLLLGLVPVLAAGALRPTVRPLAIATAVFALGAAWLGAVNFARFGDPFATGYAGSARFDRPFAAGCGDLIASARGGLFVYSPVLLLAIPGSAAAAVKRSGFAVGVWVALAASLALYAKFFSPFGGDAWGSRYLLPNAALLSIPAGLCVTGWLCADAVRRGAAAAVVTFSAALQMPPAVVSYGEVYSVGDRDAAVAPQRLVARIASEKLRGAGAYDLARLGLGEGRHAPGRVECGWNLWPERVARDKPARAGAGWAAWWALVAATTFVGGVLLRRATRRDA